MEQSTLLWTVLLASLLCTATAQSSSLVFTSEPEDVSVEVGASFNLSCRAVIIDTPSVILTYTWQLEGNSTILQQGERYSVAQATPEDEGVYVCTVYEKTQILSSRNSSVTVTDPQSGLSEGAVIAVAVSVSLGFTIILLVSIVLCLWILLCFHRGHIWNKSPKHPKVIPSRRPSIAYGYLGDSMNAAAYAPKSLSKKRSRSLTHLLTDFELKDDPYKDLLSGQSTHDVDDYNKQLEQRLEKELLDVDESLFEHDDPKQSKYKSESNLKSGHPNTEETLTDHSRAFQIEDLSKHHRKQSDPYLIHKTQYKSGNRSVDLDSSRRSSLKSCSDAPSDLSLSEYDEESSGNQSGSLFKSVRFDIHEEGDIFTDSGVATESSTPHHSSSSHDLNERRASAPEINKVKLSHRRGSAPECHCKDTDEGIDGVAMERCKSEESIEDADKLTEKTPSPPAAADTDTSKDTTHDAIPVDRTTKDAVANSVFKQMEAEKREISSAPSKTEESVKRTDQLRTLRYKEQSSSSSEEQPNIAAVQSPKDEVNIPRDRVTEMRLKFQQSGSQNEPVDSNPKIKTRPMSKLVSEKAHELMKYDIMDETHEKWKKTEKLRSEPVSYNSSRSGLKSTDDIPLFIAPVGLMPWQPKFLSDTRKPQRKPPLTIKVKNETLNDSDSDSSSDEEMVKPISPLKGFASVSPTGGKSLFSKQNLVVSPQAMQAMREIKRTQQQNSEVADVLNTSYQQARRKSVAGGLSSIPEESPRSLMRSVS